MECATSKQELRKIILAFYNNEYYLIPKTYCIYDLNRIKIAIRFIRKLPYPVFIEYLLDYLVVIVRKNSNDCFDHLQHYDCLDYSNIIVWGGWGERGGGWTAKIVDLYKRREFNFLDPLMIIEVFAVGNRYGKAYVIRFITGKGCFYKAWLPNSCYRRIREELKKCPTGFNFNTKNVYFRITHIDSFRGHPYPVIDCKSS